MVSDFDAFVCQLADALVAARAEMFGGGDVAARTEHPNMAELRATALHMLDMGIAGKAAYAARLNRFLDVLQTALAAETPND